MTREDASLPPLSLADLEALAAYDAALAAGAPRPPPPAAPGAAVLDLLHACRPDSPASACPGLTAAAGWNPWAHLAAAPAAGPPATLGRFALGDELGRGGMGVVYLATDPLLNRQVAVKVLLHRDEGARIRFQAEAAAMARVRHPNVVQVLEQGMDWGQHFLVLEYVDGPTLRRHCNGQPLPAREAARLVAAVARGVQAAHDQGIIHRDLKPANVLLTGDGTPKVSDFGHAHHGEGAGTLSGDAIGTPGYMAPEQAAGRNKDVGPAADVYGLGAILYELLTTRPPFVGAHVPDILLQVLCMEPVPPRAPNPQVPHDLETICLKCLEKAPGRRYPSAAALADDLGRFLEGRPIHARPAGLTERVWKWGRRRPALAALAATLAGAAAALVTAAILLWSTNRELTATGQALERSLVREQQHRAAAERAGQGAARARDRARAAEAETYRAFEDLTSSAALAFLSRQPLTAEQRQFLERAAAYFRRAAQTGDDPAGLLRAATAQFRLGELLDQLGQYGPAVEAWGQAELLFGRLCAGPAPPPEYLDNLARSRNNLGSSLHHLGRLEEAANALARAVPLQRRLTDVVPANPEFRRALATSYHNLSLILYAQGRGPQAEVACRQALALLEALARQSPDDRTNRWRLATARDQLALTLGLQGQEAAARAECRQGLELRRQLAADPEATPEDRKDLALSLNNLANLVQDHPAQSGEAVLAYREARDLLAELTRQYPGTASYAHDLIRCRENLAHALIRRGLGPEAVAEFRLVVAYWEKAAAAEPGNAALALDNCGRWCDLGLMLRLSPKPEEALPCLDRAEAGLQRLPAGGPDSGRARVLDKVGRHAEAIPSWERALAANAQADEARLLELGLAGALVKTDRHAEAVLLAQPRGKDAGDTLVKAAKVFAAAATHTEPDLAAAYAARAVALLRDALARGGLNGAALAADPAWAPLWGRPDYEALWKAGRP